MRIIDRSDTERMIRRALSLMMIIFILCSCSLPEKQDDDPERQIVLLKPEEVNELMIRNKLSVNLLYNDGRSRNISFSPELSSDIRYDAEGNIEKATVSREEVSDHYEEGSFSRTIDYSDNRQPVNLLDPAYFETKEASISEEMITTIYSVKPDKLNEYLGEYGVSVEGVKDVEALLVSSIDLQLPLSISIKVLFEGDKKEDLLLMEGVFSEEASQENEAAALFNEHFQTADLNDLIVVTGYGTANEKRATYKTIPEDHVEIITRPDCIIQKNMDKNIYYLLEAEQEIDEGDEHIKISYDASDFVNLSEVIPDAILEIRYYTTFNFTGVRINGYKEPVALLTRQAAQALKNAADELREKGYLLKIYDAYRPASAEDHFYAWGQDLTDTKMKQYFYPNVDKSRVFELGYVAKRSSHPRGSCLDLSIFDMKTGRDVDMGTGFDFFDESSHPDYQGINSEQYANRMILRNAMMNNGFRPFRGEWWHFTLNDEPYPNTYFDFPNALESIMRQ